MIICEVLVTCCRALLSWALYYTRQFVIFSVRMLSTAALLQVDFNLAGGLCRHEFPLVMKLFLSFLNQGSEM